MTKREYPLFLIDRSKSESYPSDYIVCLDREVGFVARVTMMYDDLMLQEFSRQAELIKDYEVSTYIYPLKKGGIVLTIEDFLYNIEIKTSTKQRIQTLLKKAVKKYFFATIEREPDNRDYGIDNQIAQQRLTIERAKANYTNLVKRAPDKESADYAIALAEATLETLLEYKRMKVEFARMFN